MDVDILKPDTGYLSVIERPSVLSATTSKNTSPPSQSSRTSPPTSDGSNSPIVPPTYTEPLSEGEEEDADAEGVYGPSRPARDEDKRTGLTGDEYKAAVEYREQMLKQSREAEASEDRQKSKGPETTAPVDVADAAGQPPPSPKKSSRPKPSRGSTIFRKLKVKALSINPLAPSSAFDETLKTKLKGAQEERDRLGVGSSRSPSRSPRTERGHGHRERNGGASGEEDEEDEAEAPTSGAYGRNAGIGDDRVLERSLRAPEGKKISVPVRIEPKVYFANERTFLVRSGRVSCHRVCLSNLRVWLLRLTPLPQ